MQKLNKEKLSQLDVLELINEKITDEYIKFLDLDSTGMKMFDFNICFIIQQGSVSANVYFEESGKLTNAKNND